LSAPKTYCKSYRPGVRNKWLFKMVRSCQWLSFLRFWQEQGV